MQPCLPAVPHRVAAAAWKHELVGHQDGEGAQVVGDGLQQLVPCEWGCGRAAGRELGANLTGGRPET